MRLINRSRLINRIKKGSAYLAEPFFIVTASKVQRRRRSERFTRLGRAASLIEKETFKMKFHMGQFGSHRFYLTNITAIMVGTAHPTFRQVVLRAP